MNFIQDRNIFDHTYFNFMWQMVSYIPTTFTEAPAAPAVPPAELPAASGSAAAAAANAGGSSGSSSSSGMTTKASTVIHKNRTPLRRLLLYSFPCSFCPLFALKWSNVMVKFGFEAEDFNSFAFNSFCKEFHKRLSKSFFYTCSILQSNFESDRRRAYVVKGIISL